MSPGFRASLSHTLTFHSCNLYTLSRRMRHHDELNQTGAPKEEQSGQHLLAGRLLE